MPSTTLPHDANVGANNNNNANTGRSASAASAGLHPPRRLVTDAPTRMFHGLFALSFVGAYLTADSEHWRLLHVSLGYGFAGLLAWRLIYGAVGPRQARLSLLWRKLTALPGWLKAVRAAPLAWASHAQQGQNLAMALAMALMLALVIPLTLSGYATYNEWGGGWAEDALEELHELFGNAFLWVVGVHLGLMALLSLLRRRNMARPMLTGRLDGAGPSPVRNNRAWLAGLLLLVWLAFMAWQLQGEPQGQGKPQSAPTATEGAGPRISQETQDD